MGPQSGSEPKRELSNKSQYEVIQSVSSLSGSVDLDQGTIIYFKNPWSFHSVVACDTLWVVVVVLGVYKALLQFALILLL